MQSVSTSDKQEIDKKGKVKNKFRCDWLSEKDTNGTKRKSLDSYTITKKKVATPHNIPSTSTRPKSCCPKPPKSYCAVPMLNLPPSKTLKKQGSASIKRKHHFMEVPVPLSVVVPATSFT